MKRALTLAVAGLPLATVLMTGCATGEVDGNQYDPHDYEVVNDDPPSQEEIDRMTEQDLAGIDSESPDETTCIDVTSYDNNWNNDMLCTRPDGSTFYTSYEGAAQYP